MNKELDQVMQEVMALKKDRERMDSRIFNLESRIKDIQEHPSTDAIYNPGFDRSNTNTSVEALSVFLDELREVWVDFKDLDEAKRFGAAFKTLLELRAIEKRGELMCPENLWKEPGYILACDGFTLDIQTVNESMNLTETLSPIFSSRQAAQAKVLEIGKDRIIRAYRTLMFSKPWPGKVSVSAKSDRPTMEVTQQISEMVKQVSSEVVK